MVGAQQKALYFKKRLYSFHFSLTQSGSPFPYLYKMQNSTGKNQIWTIGHSTRTWEEFLELLNSFAIETVVDVRSYPGSRKFPQFNKEIMEIELPKNKISYPHFKDLGGRRKSNSDSTNTIWRHPFSEVMQITWKRPNLKME